jgi:hypothetical protein
MNINERTNEMPKVLAKGEICILYWAFPEYPRSYEASVWYPDLCIVAKV